MTHPLQIRIEISRPLSETVKGRRHLRRLDRIPIVDSLQYAAVDFPGAKAYLAIRLFDLASQFSTALIFSTSVNNSVTSFH